MTDRYDRLLRWTVVVVWIAVSGWILYLLGVIDGLYTGAYHLGPIPNSYVFAMSAIVFVGTVAGTVVLARTFLGPKTATISGIVGAAALVALGNYGLPQFDPGIIVLGIVPFSLALVVISWGVHRVLKRKADRVLPTFGTFLLAVLLPAFVPLYWYLLFARTDPTSRLHILELTALGCVVVVGIATLLVLGAVWRRLAGRSFLDWWRYPGSPGTASTGSGSDRHGSGRNVPPAATSRSVGVVHLSVLVYWIVLSLLMIAWRSAFVDYDVVTRASYLLTASPLPQRDIAILAILAWIGTAASIYVLADSLGTTKSIIASAFGVIPLVFVGVAGLPVIGPDLVFWGIVPLSLALVPFSLVAHRYLRGFRNSPPTLGVFFLAVLAVVYLPLLSFVLVNPIAPDVRRGIVQLTLLGHVIALVITVAALPGSIRHFGREGSDGGDSSHRARSSRQAWPLRAGSTTGNSVRDDARTVNPATDRTLESGESATTYPVLKRGVLVVGGENGTLMAFNSETGDRLWTETFDATEVLAPSIEFRSAYVGGGACLAALDLETGNVEWRQRRDAAIAGPPIPHEDTLYVARTDGTVLARNAKDGNTRWTVDLDGTTEHEVAVVNGLVYATSPDGTVTALDADRGAVEWSVEIGGEGLGAPVVADGTVYATSENGAVWMLDADDGSKPRPATTNVDHLQRPAVTEDILVVAGRGGTVAAIDHDGVERWSVETDPVSAAPVLIDETVYVPTESTLVGLDAATGDRQWSVPVADPISGIAPVDDAVYLGTDGGLVGVPDDGAESWGSLDGSETADTDASGGDQPGSEGPAESKPGGEGSETGSDPSAGSHGTRRQEDRTSEPSSPLVDANATIEAVDPVDTDGPLQEYRADLGDGHTGAYLTALSPDHADDDSAVSSFLESATRWSGISKNANVATVFDVGESPRPWIAFDGANGRLDRQFASLDREERVDVVLDLAEAIRTGGMYNVVHGAVGPDVAYLVGDGGTGPAATMADWGLAQSIRTAVDGSIAPTPYTAPEQLSGDGEDAKTDVYRLGAMAYHLLTGTRPFAGRTDVGDAILDGRLVAPTELDDTLPPEVDDVVLRAMALDPSERYSSAYDFRQRLQAALP